jgi:sucrose phosphorylase
MFALAGVPGIYFHSLFGSRNDRAGAESSGIHRRINRQKLLRAELEAELTNPASMRARVFSGLRRLLALRRGSPAFAPGAGQRVLELDPRIFAIVRAPTDGSPAMLCLHNVSAAAVSLPAGGGLSQARMLAPYEILWEPVSV